MLKNRVEILYNLPINFGEEDNAVNRIREMRTESGMLQKDIAKKLNCSIMAISSYEREERDIDTETIRRLCEIFDCSADYLLCLSDMRKPEISEEQRAMLDAYDRLPDSLKNAVNSILEPYVEKKRKEKKSAAS